MKTCKEIDACRLCGCDDLKPLLNLGFSPLANDLRTSETINRLDVEKYPLSLLRCQRCGTAQLGHDVNPKILFSNYNYETSVGLESHFKAYAESVLYKFKDKFKTSPFVIEIGGNTGVLCREFQRLGCKVINVEPAKNIAEKSRQNGVETICEFFSYELALDIIDKYGYPDLVISNNCLAHTPNLRDVLIGIKALIEFGFLVFENAYLLDTVRNLDVGQIYHEHFFYHHLESLCRVFDSLHMTLFDAERNDMQCGSFRAFVKNGLDASVLTENLEGLIQEEIDFGITILNDVKDVWTEMGKNIVRNGDDIEVALGDLKRQGKTIAIYGVPAKLTLLLELYGLADYVKYAVEESDLKVGKYVNCNGKIRIENKQYFVDNPPDVAIIGAYNFEKRILENNRRFKGDWLRIFPKIELLKSDYVWDTEKIGGTVE